MAEWLGGLGRHGVRPFAVGRLRGLGRIAEHGGDTRADSAPHLVIFPGIVISLTVMALSLFGDALRDALDPRERVQEGGS